MNFNEREILENSVLSALQNAGWDSTQIKLNYNIMHSSSDNASKVDIVLLFKSDLPFAVIEIKAANNIDNGMKQALEYAKKLMVPFIFVTNGKFFKFHNLLDQSGGNESVLKMSEFPSPEALRALITQESSINRWEMLVASQPLMREEDGRFFSPKDVVKTIIEMVAPKNGKVYDPCIGSGGMLLAAAKYAEQEKTSLSLYGQESDEDLLKISKMNLLFNNISAEIQQKEESAVSTFDYVLTTPPLFESNQKNKDGQTNANWIRKIHTSMKANGKASFVTRATVLKSAGEERKERQFLLEQNVVSAIILLPENVYYNTKAATAIWFLDKNRKLRSRIHKRLSRVCK